MVSAGTCTFKVHAHYGNSNCILDKTISTHPLGGWWNHIRPSLFLGGPLGLVHHGVSISGGSSLMLNRVGVLDKK